MFIALEGIDGCGKTTSTQIIKEYLESLGAKVVIASPIRDNTVGASVRTLLVSHKFNNLNANAKLMLMAASHECCLDEVVLPALNNGDVVVMDRYFPSMLAYQGDGALATNAGDILYKRLPFDVVFYLDIDIDVTTERMVSRNVALEDLENVSRDEIEQRQKRYEQIFEKYPAGDFFRIDANKSLEEVKIQLIDALDSLLAN